MFISSLATFPLVYLSLSDAPPPCLPLLFRLAVPAGLVYGAIKTRSPTAPFVLGLMGALVAGAADGWDRLSPSVEELGAKVDPRVASYAPAPSAFAQSSVISTGVSNRLLK